MSEFHDVLVRVVEDGWDVEVDTLYASDGTTETLVAIIATPDEIADAYLATAEMQHIRWYLRQQFISGHFKGDIPRFGGEPSVVVMRSAGFSDSVIGWVIGDG